MQEPACGMAERGEITNTRYKKVNPDGTGSYTRPPSGKRPDLKPTKSQSAVEYILFGVVGVLIILAGIALWSQYDPEHKKVPNTLDAGLKADRVNLLFIGVGGSAHPGGGKDLADSIILASLKPSTKEAAVISVPRDMWVKIGRYGTHRLNQAHALGNEGGYPGEGAGLTADTVSEIFGQPIHAFVRIDFAAFEQMINDLGGIDVYCQRSFYDYLFQDGFQQGWHHLDGHRALLYARYRYIIGPEGDNFARELRQQQVIDAMRDKLQKRSPQDVLRLISAMATLNSHTTTNLTTPQMVSLYRTFKDVKREDIRNVSLKPFTEIFNVTRINDPGQAVRTRSGDYTELQAMSAGIFNGKGQIIGQDQIQVAAQPPSGAPLPADGVSPPPQQAPAAPPAAPPVTPQ
jgi:LCP family protein required for cell wall assembly